MSPFCLKKKEGGNVHETIHDNIFNKLRFQQKKKKYDNFELEKLPIRRQILLVGISIDG